MGCYTNIKRKLEMKYHLVLVSKGRQHNTLVHIGRTKDPDRFLRSLQDHTHETLTLRLSLGPFSRREATRLCGLARQRFRPTHKTGGWYGSDVLDLTAWSNPDDCQAYQPKLDLAREAREARRNRKRARREVRRYRKIKNLDRKVAADLARDADALAESERQEDIKHLCRLRATFGALL